MSDADNSVELTKLINFRAPISVGSKKVEQIMLVPPKVGQRRKAEQHLSRGVTPETATRYGISFVASVANVGEDIIEQMDADQFEEALSFLEGFSARGRGTGTT